MRVDWAIPCRAAKVEDSLITIVGAQIDTLFASGFPAKLTTGLALRLLFDDAELGGAHDVALRLTGPELEHLGELNWKLEFGQEPNPAKSPGWEGSHLMATLVRFEAPKAGVYTVEVSVDERHQRTLPFSVRTSSV